MTLGIGIVGCGYWGPNLIRNFERASRSRVAAICDANESRATAAHVLAPGAKLYLDYEKMLADPEVEVVAVATPVGSHSALATMALEAGKHVMVEKPLATTAREADALVDLADQKGLTLMTGHTFLFGPPVRKVKELVASDRIGKLLTVDSSRMNLGIFRGDVDVLWDLAPHDISILMYVLGETPESVASSGAAYMQQGIDDVAYLDMRFPSGVSAHVVVSWLSPVKLRRMLFVGLDGMILYDDSSESEKVKIYQGSSNPPGPEDLIREPAQIYSLGDLHAPALDRAEPLLTEAEEFLIAIESKTDTASDGRFGAQVVRVLEAADRSSASGGARIELGDLN